MPTAPTTVPLALIETLRGLLGSQDAQAIDVRDAIADSTTEDLPAKLQSLSRELLLDRSCRIELDDVINKETRRVLAALEDPEKFPVTVASGANEELFIQAVDQAQRTWKLVEPLCWSIAVAAKYADTDTLTPWSSALRSLTAFGEKPEGGHSILIQLRRLPALCLAETAAIASVSGGRWDNLRALLVTPKVAVQNTGERRPLIAVIHQYGPFEVNDSLAQVLSLTAQHEEFDAAQALAQFTERKRGKFYTPVSDWVHTVCKPAFETQFPDEEDYSDALDLAECSLGTIQQYEEIEQSKKSGRQYVSRASWYGRSTWRNRWSSSTLVDQILDDATTQGEQWPPVQAGLFGGNSADAVDAVERYRDSYNHVRGNRMF